ncbi:PQQ-binding-like beta-propeller repeat protein, partial [bacterium]|nr:PQQ-binding-like beta-propeller repeat protein [bacterium]
PSTDGYLLFADDNDNEPVLFDRANEPKPIAWLPELNPKIGHSLEMNAVDRDKGIGFTRAKPAKWKTWLPVRIRAMVKTGDTLFIAGPPDKLDPSDPLASFEGRLGSALCAVSAQDGQKQKEYTLASPPVFDGLVAANNKLYLATMDGRVLCFKGE